MAGTDRDRHRARPRPVGQSLWLLATVAFAAVALSTMGDALTVAGTTGPPPFTGEELLELADPAHRHHDGDGTGASAPSAPAAPGATDPARAASGDPVGADRQTRADDGQAEAAGRDGVAITDRSADPAQVLGQAVLDDDPSGDLQARGAEALALISYPWQELLPAWTIAFLPEREGLYGLTMVPERRIEIYLRDGQDAAFLAHVIAHELGHAVDVELNDGGERRRWEQARDIEGQPWWPTSGATDFSTGAGDFAESFAAWQVDDGSFRSTLAGPPTADQITLLAELSAG